MFNFIVIFFFLRQAGTVVYTDTFIQRSVVTKESSTVGSLSIQNGLSITENCLFLNFLKINHQLYIISFFVGTVEILVQL